jgi:signal transduction histidine kinase
MKEFEVALDYYTQGLDIVVPKHLNKPIMDAYRSMHNVYKEQGKYRQALEYFEKYHYLQDSIFNIEKSSELSSLANAYEMQQKDNEMELQEARMNEQKAMIRRQQNVMFSLLGLVVIIFVFSVMLIRQYRLRMRAWKQLLVQHEEILENRKELIKAKEKAEESDRLKTTFLVNVSHELRTPMNGIMGFTDLLQRGNASEEQNKLYLSYIASSSRQLLKVLNDIIDISSIETKQIKIEPDNHAISPIFEDLLDYYEKEKIENGKEGIEITYIKPEGAHDHHSLFDKKRFAQVLFNLLNNALRFTNDGTIEFGYNIVEGKTIKVFVKDTGTGIERSNHEMIFERFRQVDDSTTRQIGGSGLGLAISRELVKLMDGRIYLESELEVGSTFYFEIPYIPAG